ncbi:MAG: hypothetical protein CMP67_07525 [Flavobacteriales bacterium]|nr:hypothetical protein [Flavobacteriales bacterium]|tara:strand:+ start:517 stop:1011 length:495 start_codon:yes stop_codon:yes gene_type:complete
MNCPSCSKKINPKAIRCPYCKALLVSKEKFSSVVKKRKEKSLEREKKEFIKSGRNTLLIVGGLNVIPLFIYLSHGDNLSAIIEGTIAGMFLGLGLLATRVPYAALLSGIILYILLTGLSAVADPESIINGLIIKIIVIYYLFKGMRAANKFKKKYKNIDILDAA